MSVGDGIFAGLCFLGVVALYITTRDRWRWRRIVLWIVGVLAGPIVIGAAWVAVSHFIDSRPRAESEYWSLRPGQSNDEVLYRKGEPTARDGDFWYYSAGEQEVGHVVAFKDGKVRHIMAIALPGSTAYLPALQGISSSSTQEDIETKFGPPDLVSVHKDKMMRRLSYLRLGVFFGLAKNTVMSIGVFDARLGGVRYVDESKFETADSK